MTERGWPELAGPIASHPISSLIDPSRSPQGWASKAVAIADRHVAQRFVSIDERIDDQARRYPEFQVELDAARAAAHAMEAELAAAARLEVGELVARLRNAFEAAE